MGWVCNFVLYIVGARCVRARTRGAPSIGRGVGVEVEVEVEVEV